MPGWLSRFLLESTEALAHASLDGELLAQSPSWSGVVRQAADGLIAALLAVAPDAAERTIQRGTLHASAWPLEDGSLLVRARCGQASPGRFFALIDAFPFAIGVHRNFHFIYVNRAAASYLGFANVDELVGLPITQIIEPSDIGPARTRVATMMRTGEPLPERETRLLRKDGTIVIADLSAFVIRDEDGEPSYVVVARDITERKALEERLHHGQRMEAVGRLAGGIAHDFNNLLAVILSYAELISTSLPPHAPEAEHARSIQRGAERAASLTQQLLTYSRGQSAEPVSLRPNDIVRGLEGFLRRSLGPQVTLVTLLQAALPPIRASAAQLEQVLMNLVLNARDASADGVEIRLETRLVIVTAHPGWRDDPVHAGPEDLEPGPYVCIEVIDAGSGMTADVAARAFEPFFTTKSPGKGTGLGLSTVYGIVREARGRCELITAPGQGTTVRVLWPASTEALSSPVEATRLALPPVSRSSRRPDVGRKILVVEDDEAVRILVVRLLKARGFDTIEAGGGEEALVLANRAAADGEPPDLVLSDVVMPHMDGIALAEALRAIFPKLPVIFMSGFADDVIEAGDLATKGFGFVAKPFVTSELIAQVRAGLAKASTADEPDETSEPEPA